MDFLLLGEMMGKMMGVGDDERGRLREGCASSEC